MSWRQLSFSSNSLVLIRKPLAAKMPSSVVSGAKEKSSGKFIFRRTSLGTPKISLFQLDIIIASFPANAAEPESGLSDLLQFLEQFFLLFLDLLLKAATGEIIFVHIYFHKLRNHRIRFFQQAEFFLFNSAIVRMPL